MGIIMMMEIVMRRIETVQLAMTRKIMTRKTRARQSQYNWMRNF
jgi:hypothetical protein